MDDVELPDVIHFVLDFEPLERVSVRSWFGGSHDRSGRLVGGMSMVGAVPVIPLGKYKQKARLLTDLTSRQPWSVGHECSCLPYGGLLHQSTAGRIGGGCAISAPG